MDSVTSSWGSSVPSPSRACWPRRSESSALRKKVKMTAKTLGDAIAENHAALDSMLKGDSAGYVALLSDRDDVTWGNPFGPFARGRESVEATLASAATRMRGGGASEFDHVATYLVVCRC